MTVFKWTAHEYSLHIDTFKKSSATRFKIGPLPNFGTWSLDLSPLLLYSPEILSYVDSCFEGGMLFQNYVSIHAVASLWHGFLTHFAHLAFCKAQFICHFWEAFLNDPLSSFLPLP